jgi:hypothetical protein
VKRQIESQEREMNDIPELESDWEQGRRTPEGPAIALLRIAARHPRVIRENLRTAA